LGGRKNASCLECSISGQETAPKSLFIEDMDSSLATGMVAVFGSIVGAFASIASTWMTQEKQRIRERAHEELQRRETLYSDFMTETAV
jgi:hypothetical protein